MFKYVVYFCLINSYFCDKSFTVVLDTTKSMREEINVVKANIGRVLNNLKRTNFENYILVPFKDIAVESPFTTENKRDFISHINTISTSGGLDCPENSLAGIEAALRISNTESYIFVFTDAYAKDYNSLRTIQDLCKDKHSQVIIFLTGFCLSSNSVVGDIGRVDVYYDIAKSCSGAFFRFDTTLEFRHAFRFMEQVANSDWTDVSTQQQFTESAQYTRSLDSYTSEFVIVASGDYPVIQVSKSNEVQRKEIIVETRHALVVRLVQPEPGSYTINIIGRGPLSVTFFEKHQITFEYGFSPKSPRSLAETSSRPIAGSMNYVLIKIDTSLSLTEIEWLNVGENSLKVIFLREMQPGLYVTSVFIEPEKSFRFWIKGRDLNKLENIKGSTKLISPQMSVTNTTWTKPNVEILEPDTNLVDYGSVFTLICKVFGYPKPNIKWEDESFKSYPSEVYLLEIPNLHISYITIQNATKNSTFYCKAENHEGDDSQSLDIFVNRTFTFDVISSPEDTSVEFGSKLELPCQVDAFPEASTNWYHNDSKVDFDTEEHALIIEEVGLNDGGEYECEVSNDVETKNFKATVTVTGIEKPEIDKEETEVIVKPGDWKEIQCSILKGKPDPEIAWKYRTFESYLFGDLPADTKVEDGVLKIPSAEKKHAGVYKCVAANALGEDFKEISVKIQFSPIIKNSDPRNISVMEGNDIRLECEVEAAPDATVRWEMSQDDVIVIFDHRHVTDDDKKHTHSFTALYNDSGNYHCIAENNIGRAEKTITVNVIVSPYIEPPAAETVDAKLGDNVTLPCRVLYGNPAATVKWEFTAPDSTTRILSRDKSTNSLKLKNITKSHEGKYLCIAENEYDTDRIMYTLKVQ